MTGKIKLVLSGGNAVSIAVPTLNPSSSEVEFKLPQSDGSANQYIKTDGSGNLGFATLPSSGKILSVTQTVKTDTFSQLSVNEGTASNDVISLSFAATSSSNKLLIHYSLSGGSSAANRVGCVLAIGGTVQTAFQGDSAGSRTRVMSTAANHASWAMNNLAGMALVSSPSTSSTTYSFRLIHGNNAQTNLYLNRSHEDNDAGYMQRPVSMITIMEVAA